MNENKLKELWKKEEAFAFQGWDFSHIKDRWACEELRWSYGDILRKYLKQTDCLLDMGTGGGEFLLTLGHPHPLTSVTEAYPPNVSLCQRTLSPLGITVKQTYDDDQIPYEDARFDLVINRHESFDVSEVNRVLRSGGHFITQQVGQHNNAELSKRLIDGFVPKFPSHRLGRYLDELSGLGYDLIKQDEMFPSIKFFDVGALVFFAKIIEWEFPNFSVDSCFDQLLDCQRELEEHGFVQSSEHRFLIVARKP
ncbi:MAG: methyltransferase domain-containing protein [Clostridiales bacterium]|nr:methyltransferase domain-containing protein [Clostridiales bacterium]